MTIYTPAEAKVEADKIGHKPLADGSVRFKLVGGPYHDMVLRLYGPWDRLVFRMRGHHVYDLAPPVSKRSNKWVYVHNRELSDKESHEPYTEP